MAIKCVYFFRYDFYLISQSVNQGTVSPTHYNVLYDNTGLDADKMQRLTYKLTHLYYNWSVSIILNCISLHNTVLFVRRDLYRYKTSP